MRRLLTKEDRQRAQAADFDGLLQRGYQKEVWKGLIFWTRDEDNNKGRIEYVLKVYKENAAHDLEYKYYRDAVSRQAAIDSFKSSYDRRADYKAELKANPTKSSAANCSAAIKAELSKIYPGVKFSVRSDTFSGGNSVHIGWSDGPTSDEVETITGKYQYGHFNGMEDIYESSNTRDDIPQAKYVSEHRTMSESTRAILEDSAAKLWAEDPDRFEHYRTSGVHDSGNFAYRVFTHYPIPLNAKVLGITKTQLTSGCATPENFYCLDIEQTTSEAPVYEPQEVTAGTVQIIDYSEKAIAVIGDTKAIKDKLKELGGRFNFRLTCGPGWIFKKSDLIRVQDALTAPKTVSCAEYEPNPGARRGYAIPQPEEIAPEPTTDEQINIEAEESAPLQFDRHYTNVSDEEIKDRDFIESLPTGNGDGSDYTPAREPEPKHYDNLQDIEQAANSGEVIDLMNLYEIVNKPKIEKHTQEFFAGVKTGYNPITNEEKTNGAGTIQEQRKQSDQRKSGRSNTGLPAPQMFLF